MKQDAALYLTHYMEEAERLCDRVLILDHGQILANETVAYFKQQYTNLEAAFMQLTGRALRDGAESLTPWPFGHRFAMTCACTSSIAAR